MPSYPWSVLLATAVRRPNGCPGLLLDAPFPAGLFTLLRFCIAPLYSAPMVTSTSISSWNPSRTQTAHTVGARLR